MVWSTRRTNFTVDSAADVTAEQQHINLFSNQLSSDWPLSLQRRQNNTSSRGVENHFRGGTGHACYVISTIQTILHAPKIMSWINTHNVTLPDGTTQNPCWPTLKGKQPVREPDGFEIRTETPTPSFRQCIACTMKRIISDYWGNYKTAPPNGVDRPLFMDRRYLPVQAIFDFAIGNAQRRGEPPTDQQDAAEFLPALLEAIRMSTHTDYYT